MGGIREAFDRRAGCEIRYGAIVKWFYEINRGGEDYKNDVIKRVRGFIRKIKLLRRVRIIKIIIIIIRNSL